VGGRVRHGACFCVMSVPSVAFVLGAGLGTRLKTLTAHLPKPLLPVCNEPLITRAFAHLREAGVARFVVNTHWQAQAYAEAFPTGTWEGLPLSFSHESPEVLETAGGLKHAQSSLPAGEPVWVYNGDILSTLPLQQAWEAHRRAGNEVTLVLRSKDGPLQVSLDRATGRIRDLGCRLEPGCPAEFLFTGIYLVEPAFLERIPAGQKLSVVPVFLEMIRQGARLGGVVVDGGEWWDLGTREQVLAVHGALTAGRGPWVADPAGVDPSARLVGATAVGAGAVVGAGALLEDSVVWAGAHIQPGAVLRRCIVTAKALVSGTHTDADL
jgi:mannose-1-phosphate guanylyltransferase